MRTARLTGHLFAALLCLSTAAMMLAHMFAGRNTDRDDGGWTGTLLLFAAFGYAAYSIARTILTITEKK